MFNAAMSNIAGEDFILPQQKDDENPVVFEIGPLDGLQYLDVMTELVKTETGGRFTGQGMIKIVKYGIKGWRNFKFKGVEMPFSKENIKLVHGVHLSDIADRIIDLSVLGADEVKNS